MKLGREAKGVPSAADLLVCFPSRAHLTLMSKAICSPARPSEANNRRRNHHHHHLKKLSTRGAAGHAKQKGHEIAEPTSPKVTCVGQIKVMRPKDSSCSKSWQSVMEEIERIRNDKHKNNKKPSWVESIGFKKDIMQFLSCLKNTRFDFRCFGAVPHDDITTEDDEDDENEKYEANKNHEGVEERSCSIVDDASSSPPTNALLLMRCRSAPAKSRLQDKAEDKEEEGKENNKEFEDKEEEKEVIQMKKDKNLKSLVDEEKRNNMKNLVVMAYDTDFYRISSDIVKETWVVDGVKDLLSRSRSWKR